MSSLKRPLALASVALLVSCSGTIAPEGGSEPGAPRIETPGIKPPAGTSGPVSSGPGASRPAASSNGCGAEMRVPLRRLTQSQYNNTVQDLFQSTRRVADRFPQDDQLGAFVANVESPVGIEHVDQFMFGAETMAAEAVSKLSSLLPCAGDGTAPDACAQRFIRDFGRRAWRRPLTAMEEQDLFASVFKKGADFTGGIRMVIEALLQSPDFVYMIEGRSPSAANLATLTDYELATRLSYFLWDRPDDKLFSLAAEGRLGSPDVLRAEVARMVRDPKAKAVVANFHAQWLHLKGLELTTIDEGLRAAMMEETAQFLGHLFTEGDGRLETLLTAPYTFVNGDLAKHYGLAAPTGSGFSRAMLNPEQRAGILGHASFLAANAGSGEEGSEIFRGLILREELLCTPLPPPLPGSAEQTEVDRLKTEPCRSCHMSIDPMGLAFKQFDSTGLFVPQAPSRGEINGTLDADGSYASAMQLVSALSRSKHVGQCVGAQWLRFALGTSAEWDSCTAKSIVASAGGASLDLRELVGQVVLSDAFRMRSTD